MESKLRCSSLCFYWIKFFRVTTYVDVPVDLVETRLRARRRGVLLENVLHEKCMERAPDFRAEGRQPASPPSPFPSRHVNRIPPEGYPIAEKGYKNRINRVYDATKGEGNATKANISETSETSHPRAIALERIPILGDFLANRVGGSFPRYVFRRH